MQYASMENGKTSLLGDDERAKPTILVTPLGGMVRNGTLVIGGMVIGGGLLSTLAYFMQPSAVSMASAPSCPSVHTSTPPRFLVSGVTPSSHQLLRGDCYLFSGSGILEDSYRRYGVERGWFDAAKYMRLSRQALGIAYMETCKKYPMSYCPAVEVTVEGGATMISWGNTTEGRDGGDEKIFAPLSQISDLGKIGPLPVTVCPYTPVAGLDDDWKCDGLAEARSTNPLEFKVNSWKTHFARDDIKRTLVERGYPLSLGLGEVSSHFHVPCDARRGCDKEKEVCEACPHERVYEGITCCITIERPMVSMKGASPGSAAQPRQPSQRHRPAVLLSVPSAAPTLSVPSTAPTLSVPSTAPTLSVLLVA